jgi:hypothetical protein
MLRGPYAIFAVAALLLSGCAAERTVLVRDETLTAAAIRDGGLAVVGVTMIQEVEQIRPPLIAALERVMEETRPDLPFQTADSVRATLGLPASRAVLASYQRTGALADPALRDLAADLGGGVRFAIFARIEKSNVHYPPPPREDAFGFSGPIGSQATSRDARVRLTLYDLSRREVAMEAVYASSSENALPDSIAKLPARTRGTLGDPGPATPPPLPEVPSLADASVEAFRAFAYELPR